MKKYVGWVWIDTKSNALTFQKDLVPEEYLNYCCYCANPEILDEDNLPHIQVLYDGSSGHHIIEAQIEFFICTSLQEKIYKEFYIDMDKLKIIPMNDIGIIFPKKEAANVE